MALEFAGDDEMTQLVAACAWHSRVERRYFDEARDSSKLPARRGLPSRAVLGFLRIAALRGQP